MHWLKLLQEVRSRTSVRGLAAGAVLLAATLLFASLVQPHYPIEEWLFFHYAGYWLAVVVWAAGCFGTGAVLLERVFRMRLPLFERLSVAFVLGLFAFELVMFLFGLGHAYRKSTFFVAPLLLLVFGWQSLLGLARGARRLLRRAPPRRSAARYLAFALGAVGLLLVYFSVLTPENVQFDTRWKHMALAEDYVVHGGVRRATEGWLFSARPHFTSFLYVWAFLAPSERLFDKMLLGAHLEYFTFATTTLLGIPALVRRLVPRADPSTVWAARFLFPGLFVYDSSVSAGADHFGAAYSVPIALVLLRVLGSLELGGVALLATLFAGATLVKETAALLLVPLPAAAVAVRCVAGALRRNFGRWAPLPPRRFWLAPLIGLGVGLLATSPLWLKNLVFYGDPLYPSLNRFFWPNPWSEAAAYKFRWAYADSQMWAPTRDFDGLVETLRALFEFSFVPHDWSKFHGKVPVFGSLFTLLLGVLPFLRGTRRVWFFVLWVHVGLFAWFSVHHQDRYLQALVPLMAAVVAATVLLVWRSFGPLVKACLALLIALQVVWGGDAYFFPTHAMAGLPAKRALDLLGSGYAKDYESRFDVQVSYAAIGKDLPKDARVLFHEHHPHLGVGRESVLDSYQWQYAIDYGAEGSPEAVRQLLERLGVTHVHYFGGKSNGNASIASDIVFDAFVRGAPESRRVSGGAVVTVPNAPMTAKAPSAVLVLSCKRQPKSGLYALGALDAPSFGPRKNHYAPPLRPAADAEQAAELLPEAEYVLLEPDCLDRGARPLGRDFELSFKRRKGKGAVLFEVWRRMPRDGSAGRGPEPKQRERKSEDPDRGEPDEPSDGE